MKFAVHPNWRSAYKWLSVQLGAVVVAAPLIYQQFPQLLQPYVNTGVFRYTMAGLGALVILNAIRAKSTPS